VIGTRLRWQNTSSPTSTQNERHKLVDQTCVAEHTGVRSHHIDGLCRLTIAKTWRCRTHATICTKWMETTRASDSKSILNVPKGVPALRHCHQLWQQHCAAILVTPTSSRFHNSVANNDNTYPNSLESLASSLNIHSTSGPQPEVGNSPSDAGFPKLSQAAGTFNPLQSHYGKPRGPNGYDTVAYLIKRGKSAFMMKASQ